MYCDFCIFFLKIDFMCKSAFPKYQHDCDVDLTVQYINTINVAYIQCIFIRFERKLSK